jgi:O-antigen ligase
MLASFAAESRPEPSRVERLLALGCIVALSGVVTPLFAGPWPDDLPVAGAEPNRAWWAIFHIVALALVARRVSDVVAGAARLMPVLLVVALAIASALWSISPMQSLLRGLALASTTLFAVYLAVVFNPPAWLSTLRQLALVLVAANLVAVIVAPELAIMTGKHAGAWRGLMAHKNQLGATAVFAVLVLASSLIFWQASRFADIVGACGAIILLVTSRSFSSMVIAGSLTLAAPAFLAWKSLRSRGGLSLAFALSLVGLTSIAVAAFGRGTIEFLLGLANRDLTLTGRTDLWSVQWEMVLERPLLGYGFGVFWTVTEGPAAILRYLARWDATDSHNGFLELCLDVGVVGLAVFLFPLVTTLYRLLSHPMLGYRGFWEFAILFLLVFLLANTVESLMLRHNNLLWLVFVSLLAQLAKVRPPVLLRAPMPPGAGGRLVRST